jgi:hypothetical protein
MSPLQAIKLQRDGMELSEPVLIPTIFMGAMVRAILAKNKRRTSRLITAKNSLVNGQHISERQWKEYQFNFDDVTVDTGPSITGNPGPFLKVGVHAGCIAGSGTRHRIYSLLNPETYNTPLYLWVRENTWYYTCNGHNIHYSASELPEKRSRGYEREHPSIHMKYKDCRAWLHVTGFKAERIQDISDEDCIAEGIRWELDISGVRAKNYTPGATSVCTSLRDSFRSLWEQVHPGSWERNDWVWAPLFSLQTTDPLQSTSTPNKIHA